MSTDEIRSNGERVAALKACSKCGDAKTTAEFYGRSPYCKACDNSRPRKPSALKINRNRARHRAIADLIAAHESEFNGLLSLRLSEATAEAEALATMPAAAEHGHDEPLRLRPGPRMQGQKAGDRIDVARCPHCIKSHDRGHVCTSCGLASIGALRLPDDGELDEIAIERAMNGDAVKLTASERAEATRRMTKRGLSAAEIAERLHVTSRTIQRERATLDGAA